MLAMIATVVGVVLLASLWMQWAQVGFDASVGMLSGIKLDVTGWKVHDVLDIVLAGAAAIAILANATLAAGNGAVGGGPASFFAGIISGGVVAWTMIEPPVPEIFDAFNAIPGVPDLQFDPAYGLFVALGASVGLILLG
ncbi:MAG: hypothetical protein Q7V62_12415, partial [Actinomycetota bacterium]|nr:hypothetical protein [Actinomycetota bacterium]